MKETPCPKELAKVIATLFPMQSPTYMEDLDGDSLAQLEAQLSEELPSLVVGACLEDRDIDLQKKIKRLSDRLQHQGHFLAFSNIGQVELQSLFGEVGLQVVSSWPSQLQGGFTVTVSKKIHKKH